MSIYTNPNAFLRYLGPGRIYIHSNWACGGKSSLKWASRGVVVR